MNIRTSRSLITSALFAILAAGCNGGGTATSAQAITGASERGDHGGGRFRRGGHDPAQMVQQFDQNGNGTLEVAELPERMQQRLGAADTNRDGVIATEEINAFHTAQRAERFTRLDTNSDGAITSEEAGERWAFVGRADTDSDGRVSRAEMDQAETSGAFRGPRGEHGGPGMLGRGGPGGGGFMGRGGHDPARFVEHFDRNGNGTVEVAELPERMQARMGADDTNRDGVLSTEEMTAARAAHRAARMGAPADPSAPTAPVAPAATQQ